MNDESGQVSRRPLAVVTCAHTRHRGLTLSTGLPVVCCRLSQGKHLVNRWRLAASLVCHHHHHQQHFNMWRIGDRGRGKRLWGPASTWIRQDIICYDQDNTTMVVRELIVHLFISDITFLYVSFLLLAIRFHDKSVITKHYSQVHHECGPGLSVVLV